MTTAESTTSAERTGDRQAHGHRAGLDRSEAGCGRAAFSPRESSPSLVVVYKVKGKTFAILSVRGVEDVIVKCEPEEVEVLREKYAGIGHRSHLDRRFWVSVRLDADVPLKEIRRLVSLSYDVVCAKLAAKQKAELERLSPPL